MIRMRRPPAVGLAAAALGCALLLAACGEDVDVGRDEAIEVLVLDGVPRERAECIVDGLDGVVPFDKVTGVDPDISEDQLADLAGVSATCTVIDDTSAGIVGGGQSGGEIEEGGGVAVDIDAEVERLVSGGLDPMVGDCVRSALFAAADPAGAVESENFVTEAIRICSR